MVPEIFEGDTIHDRLLDGTPEMLEEENRQPKAI